MSGQVLSSERLDHSRKGDESIDGLGELGSYHLQESERLLSILRSLPIVDCCRERGQAVGGQGPGSHLRTEDTLRISTCCRRLYSPRGGM